MSEHREPDLTPALRKLNQWESFSDADTRALLELPHQIRAVRAHHFFVREQEKPRHCCVLLEGFAIRHKTTGNGDRQIFSIHLPGDFIDLHNSMLRTADHSVEALTSATGAFIDASIFREWMLNIGRRDALTRTAHMLCEFSVRMEVAGLGDHDGYELPMTQAELADALALTAVHVNRTIKVLREEGLVEFDKRAVRIIDFPRLAQMGDFDPRYLHLQRNGD